MNPKTSSRVGPKLRSKVCQSGGGAFSGLALMVTPCCSSSGSRLSSANEGRCVVKWVALTELLEDSLIAVLVTPVMASPVVVTLTTLSAATCCLKTLYGIVMVVGWAGAKRTLVTKMLMSSRMPSVIQKRAVRNGFGRGGIGPFAGLGGLEGLDDGGR